MHGSVKEMTQDELMEHVIECTTLRDTITTEEINVGGDHRSSAKIGKILHKFGFVPIVTRKGGTYKKEWKWDLEARIAEINASIKKLEKEKIRLNAQKAPKPIRNDALFKPVVEYAVSHDICFVDAIIQHYKWGTTNGEKARVKKILEGIGLPQKEFRKVGFGG